MYYKLSPSDLTFLYEGCRRCFYLKVIKNIAQPSIPLPAVFSKIASLLKTHYSNKHTAELHPDLPPGTVILGEKWVKSQSIHMRQVTCQISGRFDIVIRFDDGSYGVVDFKTGNPTTKSAALYARQLHAYAFSLEHPANGALALSPVSRLGLLYFYPEAVTPRDDGRLAWEAQPTWIEVEKDEGSFLKFLDKVLRVLELPEPPICETSCPWCSYVQRI